MVMALCLGNITVPAVRKCMGSNPIVFSIIFSDILVAGSVFGGPHIFMHRDLGQYLMFNLLVKWNKAPCTRHNLFNCCP